MAAVTIPKLTAKQMIAVAAKVEEQRREANRPLPKDERTPAMTSLDAKQLEHVIATGEIHA